MRITRSTSAILLLILSLCLSPHSQAAILAYDGFEAGGSTPTASQYHTAGGYPTDAIAYFDLPAPDGPKDGQNPTTLGFSGKWSSTHTTSSSVYARALSSSLTYTSPDSIVMATTSGSASIFRSGGTVTSAKTFTRDISITGALPTTLYFSVLVNFTSNQPIDFRTQTLGATIKPDFGFGINSSGLAYVSLNGTSSPFLTSTALATNTTHLLVMKIEQSASPATNDTISLYVNPNLGSEPTTAAVSHTSDFYVAQNAAYELTNLSITGSPSPGGSVTFDEFRISTNWNDIATAVPEPSRIAFLTLATSLLLCTRQRKKLTA